MDLTIEEVAQCIQDVRYQRAIGDPGTPVPEKGFPFLGRIGSRRSLASSAKGSDKKSVPLKEIVGAENIKLSSMVSCPIGRYFLRRAATAAELGSWTSRLKGSGSNSFSQSAVMAGDTRMYSRSAVVDRMNSSLSAMSEDTGRERANSDGSASGGGIVISEEVDRQSGGLGGDPISESIVGATRIKNMELALECAERLYTIVNDSPDKETRRMCVERLAREYNMDAFSETDEVAEDDDDDEAGGENDDELDEDPVSVSISATTSTQVSVSVADVSLAVPRKNEKMPPNDPRGNDDDKNNNRPSSGSTIELPSLPEKQKSRPKASFFSSDEHTSVESRLRRRIFHRLRPAFEAFSKDPDLVHVYVKVAAYAELPVDEAQVRYHRALGNGAFGTVHGCILATTGCMLACKVMFRDRVKFKKAADQVKAERAALEALALSPSNFCMSLRYAFKTKDAYQFLLPLAIGGDLKFHLQTQGKFDITRAWFYAVEIALGLGHCHSLGILLRDLKTRNVLLDSDGHCKISDLGLSLILSPGERVKGRAGTEGYWSPEVINSLVYGFEADWWSYGCVFYELFAGHNPFSCKHTKLKTRNQGTRRGRISYKSSVNVPASAKELIEAMLNNKPPAERLHGLENVVDVTKFAFWNKYGGGKKLIERLSNGDLVDAPWKPSKGVIYALPQDEIGNKPDEEKEMRKIRLTPDDDIDFPPFMDKRMHQNDIVKVLEYYDEKGKFGQSMFERKKTIRQKIFCCVCGPSTDALLYS